MKKQSLEEYLKKHGHNKTARDHEDLSPSTLTYQKNIGCQVETVKNEQGQWLAIHYPAFVKIYKRVEK